MVKSGVVQCSSTTKWLGILTTVFSVVLQHVVWTHIFLNCLQKFNLFVSMLTRHWPTPYRSSPDLSDFGEVAGQYRVSGLSNDFLPGSDLETWTWLFGHSRIMRCFLQSHFLLVLARCSGHCNVGTPIHYPSLMLLLGGRRLLPQISQ